MLPRICRIISISLLCCLFYGTMQAQKHHAGVPYGWEPSSLRKGASLPFVRLPVDTVPNKDFLSRRCYMGNVCPVNIDLVRDGRHLSTDSLDIWRIGLYSPGAASISLIFSSYELDPRSGVYLYTPDGQAMHGCYGADNALDGKSVPMSPVPGDSLIVEYQVPHGARTGALVIGEAAHNFRQGRQVSDFGSSNDCSPHSSTDPALAEIQRAACHLYICGQTTTWCCTGTLVNSEEHRPYVYTAAHCYDGNSLSAQELARRTVFTFNYEVPARDTLIQGSEECSIAGANLRANSTRLDFTLLELDEMPPKDYRPYLAGWSREALPDGTYTSVQHPNGDSKRLSYTHRPTATSYPQTTSFTNNAFWFIDRWETGTTEVGSSGSGLFNPDLRVVGALTGGWSYCTDPCNDYYSRFDMAWDYYSDSEQRLQPWLNPSGNLTVMDGFDPYAERHTCTRVCNLADNETAESLFMPNRTEGYLCGHNSARIAEYAERFDFDSKKTLYGAYLMVGSGVYNANCPVRVSVYADEDGKPGELLAQSLFAPQIHQLRRGNISSQYKSSYAAKENYIRFAFPMQVGTTCHVAYALDYAALGSRDSFHVLAVNSAESTALWLQDGQWRPFDDSPYTDAGVKLWIEPVVSDKDLTAVREVETAKQRCRIYPNPTKGVPVSFEGGQTCSYRLYDLSGRLVLSGTGSSFDPPANPGMYLLTCSGGFGHETLKLLVVR